MTAPPFDPCGPLQRGTTLLEASAGTGKTYTIASLVLRLVAEDNVPLDRILVVTFTNAAAAQLVARIRARLSLALNALRYGDPPGDDAIVAHLAKQSNRDQLEANLHAAVTGFDRAEIGTIHGFCQRVLAELGLLAGVDATARLMEDTSDVLDAMVHDYWISRLYNQPVAAQTALRRHKVTFDDLRKLAKVALRNADAPVLPPDPGVTMPPGDDLLRAARAAVVAEWRRDGPAALAAILAAREAGDLNGNKIKEAGVEKARKALERLASGATKDSDAAELLTCCANKLGNSVNNNGTAPTHPIFTAVAAFRTADKAFVDAARPFALTFKHRFAHHLRAELGRRADDEGWRSFDGQIRDLRDAIDQPDGARLVRALGDRFDAVLVDEFQDTDPVQWGIFRACFADDAHRLYLIGDPKQAIYRFRGADIAAYLQAALAATRKRTLPTSYRHDASLAAAFNTFFGRPVGEPFATPGIDFPAAATVRDDARLRTTDARVRFRFVASANDGRVYGGKIKATWLKKHLPDWVAADIVRTLTGSDRIRDEREGYRRVRPGDCAVLVRTHEQAALVRAALAAAAVPAVVHSPISVFAQDEAKALQQTLAAILDPSRGARVRAALTSPLFGRTAADLDAMRDGGKQWETWAERFRGWHQAWHDQGFVRMFRQLSSAILETVLAMEDGERRATNLLHLGELLHAAEAERALKPDALLAWLAGQRKHHDGDAEDQQIRLERDTNAVEVVTIYKSKGLEYPLVWCPFLWGAETLRGDDKRHTVFRDPALGNATRLDIAQSQRGGDLATGEIQAESLRLLYVAVTRARHRVTIHWGPVSVGGASALAYTLHRDQPATDADSLAAVFDALKGKNEATLRAELQALAGTSGGAIDVVTEDEASPATYVADTRDDGALAAREWRREGHLDNWWRRTSFSALIRNAAFDEAAMQVAADEDDASHVGGAGAEDARPVPLAELPGGRRTGNFLHKVLEEVDFQGLVGPSLEAVVDTQCRAHGLDAKWAEPVTRALAAAFTTRLDGDVRLADIARGRRFDELEFLLPVAGGSATRVSQLTKKSLADAFRGRLSDQTPPDYPDRVAGLGFMPTRGFLTGSIDLVFQAPDGRFWVVDYKSNRLGTRAADYTPERLAIAMAEHHYTLQAHLYAVAVRRYLRERLPSYDHARDFGGVMYLFLRGLHPELPAGCGVFRDTPSVALLDALDNALKAAS